jgi:tRNA A37 threonylcarbamoyladenosine synthetase subunit TsaC/SUA5/YrdC
MVLENGEGGWDGFRVPDHPVALAWLRQLDFAPAVTSANLSGQAAATTAEAAARALGDGVALVLDAGASPGGTASTVVRVRGDRGIEVLREGPISAGELRAVVEGRGQKVEGQRSKVEGQGAG